MYKKNKINVVYLNIKNINFLQIHYKLINFLKLILINQIERLYIIFHNLLKNNKITVFNFF